MLYQLHELTRNLLAPWVHQAQANARFFANQGHWWSQMPGADRLAAVNELFHRIGKDYEKPEWGINEIDVDGERVPIVVHEEVSKPFCKLLRFKRHSNEADQLHTMLNQPFVLVVAPLSGHHATLLRDTVRALLPGHDVYVTDWIDARMVPLSAGPFHLNDYVRYVQDFIRHLGPDVHVISVCQPTVPVLAAVSLMASANDPCQPRSMVMMGGPIDPRQSPTQVNRLATTKPYSWFENQVIHPVPPRYPGSGRKVYPGFLQHAGFMAMNPDRHMKSHYDFYLDLLRGDDSDAEAHRRFYDEYNAVLDMPAEFYLDTIRMVFQEFALPNGTWEVDGQLVRPADIKKVALFTIEGELDDISGQGQTRAAIKLCRNIPADRKMHYTAPNCGHYGIFSGRRWREMICPKIAEFIRQSA